MRNCDCKMSYISNKTSFDPLQHDINVGITSITDQSMQMAVDMPGDRLSLMICDWFVSRTDRRGNRDVDRRYWCGEQKWHTTLYNCSCNNHRATNSRHGFCGTYFDLLPENFVEEKCCCVRAVNQYGYLVFCSGWMAGMVLIKLLCTETAVY